MIAYFFGYIDIGGEIGIVSIRRERIGIARFAYQVCECGILGFFFGKRAYLIIEIKVCYRFNREASSRNDIINLALGIRVIAVILASRE